MRITRSHLIVGVISLGAIAAVVSHFSGFTAEPLPQINASFDDSGMWRQIVFVSHDQRQIIINRVVINRKFGNPDCDLVPDPPQTQQQQAQNQQQSDSSDPLSALLPPNPLPATLSFSDKVAVLSESDCNDPAEVDIYTDHGSEKFTFNPTN